MNSCISSECFIRDTGKCHKLNDPLETCPDFRKDGTQSKQIKSAVAPSISSGASNNLQVPWDGEYLTPNNLSIVTSSSTPYIIGLIGNINAGKTTFLATIFTLLLNKSQFKGHQFAGSYTLDAWDRLAHTVKFNNGAVQFPNSTSSNPNFYSLYHFRLLSNIYRDLLFADGSGEVFTQWASNANDINVDSAKWIDVNSNAFIFFVDCESLVLRKAAARSEILDIAYRLKDSVEDRPVAIAFSKGDMLKKLGAQFITEIETELDSIFQKNKKFKISNYSFSDSDAMCHVNNIEMINWLLKEIAMSKNQVMTLHDPSDNSKDYFFKYAR